MQKYLRLLTGMLMGMMVTLTSQAQDKIIRKDGTTLDVRILGTDNTYIRYKRFDNLTGPDYFIFKTDVQRFDYEKKAEPIKPPAVLLEKKPDPAAASVVPEKKPEPVQPQPVAVQPATTNPTQPTTTNPELAALEKQMARYKSKSALNTALGAGAVVGGIVTFFVVNGAYSTYKSQLDGTNSAYTSWYTQNYGSAPNTGDLAQPKGLFQFGSPGVYAAAAGVVVGGILTILGRKNAGLARQTAQELERKQKAISVAPLLNPATQFAGIHIRMNF